MERNRFSEFLIEKGGLFITAIFSIIIILLIVSFILIEGLPAFEDYGFFRFLFGMTWAPNDGDFGVFAMIIGSIYVTMLSLLMAVHYHFFVLYSWLK